MEYRPEFTTDQEKWICYQIGNWYLDFKHKILPDGVQHQLGTATENLKSRLCQKNKKTDWKLKLLNDLMKERSLELTEEEKNLILKILELDENR